jgi:hypothetical protein
LKFEIEENHKGHGEEHKRHRERTIKLYYMFIHKGKDGMPLPPYDPDMKELVRTKGGWYYLRNRKPTGKDAVINETFKINKSSLQVCSPVAARIRQKLDPWIKDLTYGNTSRIILRGLLKSYKENGGSKIDYKYFLNVDLFEEYTLEKLMGAMPNVKVTKNGVEVTIPIKANTVKRQNNVVNSYYFELILLWGDPLKENALRVEDTSSELYPYGKAAKTPCVLDVVLPGKKVPWMCILKVGSMEYKQPAAHMKNYAMFVVAVGG